MQASLNRKKTQTRIPLWSSENLAEFQQPFFSVGVTENVCERLLELGEDYSVVAIVGMVWYLLRMYGRTEVL